jgi:hypothetical protein
MLIELLLVFLGTTICSVGIILFCLKRWFTKHPVHLRDGLIGRNKVIQEHLDRIKNKINPVI